MNLTDSERWHVTQVETNCTVRSTPESLGAAIRHSENLKEFVSIRGPFDTNGSLSSSGGLYSWQRTPYD